MNANELADFVEISNPNDKTHQLIATMLRQQQAKLEKSQELLREYTALNMRQQAEIEALKALNKSIIDDPLQFMKIKAQEK
jgi:hypothetical protein